LHWHKLYPGLVQYPLLNFDVSHPQQVKRAADIVLLTHTLGRMALDSGFAQRFRRASLSIRTDWQNYGATRAVTPV